MPKTDSEHLTEQQLTGDPGFLLLPPNCHRTPPQRTTHSELMIVVPL
jgi:hypothetical protein